MPLPQRKLLEHGLERALFERLVNAAREAGIMLKERCLGGPSGRTKHPVRQTPGRQVRLHYHEEVLQEARTVQRTPEHKRALRERLRPRAKVERKIVEVLRLHELRQGRYFGLEKPAIKR